MAPCIKILREGETNVWIEISARKGEKPVLQRSLNLWHYDYVTPQDSSVSIRRKIIDQCHTWYQRAVHLEQYCQRALQWIGQTSQGTQVQLRSIDEKKVIWEYKWQGNFYEAPFKFSQEHFMCVDWVCADGVTEMAEEFMVSDVVSRILHDEKALKPTYIKTRDLIKDFLAELEPYRNDIEQAAAVAYHTVRPFTPFTATLHIP